MFKLGETITDDEVDKIFCESDINGDGKIDYKEFVKLMKIDSLKK